jgi:hypothetical protein
MSVILGFIVFVIVGDGVAVAIASLVERFSQSASLLVVLALFILVSWIGWISAVQVTERYLLRRD